MKRTLIFIAILLALISLCSCQNNSDDTNGPIASYDTVREVAVSDGGGFTVSQKKFDYNGGNVIILHTESHSDKAYNVVISGKYLDENGNVLSNSTKIFKGYPAGYENYFVFSPGSKFDSFTYELSATPFDGETFAEYVKADTEVEVKPTPRGGDLDGNTYDKPRVSLFIDYHLDCSFNDGEELTYGADFVLFDNNGEIFWINNMREGSITYAPEGSNRTRGYDYPEDVLWEDYKLPAELKGDLSGIVAFTKVEK